jgi:hypothetical protein
MCATNSDSYARLPTGYEQQLYEYNEHRTKMTNAFRMFKYLGMCITFLTFYVFSPLVNVKTLTLKSFTLFQNESYILQKVKM